MLSVIFSAAIAWRQQTAGIVALLALVLSDVAAGQSSAASRALDRVRAAERAVASNRDTTAAFRDIQQLVDGPVFSDLNSEGQHAALTAAVRLALNLQRSAEANALLRRASEHERAVEADWYARFRTGVEIEAYEDAIAALKEYVERFPGKVASVYPPSIYSALQQMRTNARADVATDALEILFAGRWLAAAGQEPSSAWRDLALARLERNDLSGAVEVAARIASPAVLISMRVDKRFDEIVAASPARFDIARAVDAEIESLRRAVVAIPDRLEPVNLLALALKGAGRFEEALALVDGTLARAADVNRVSPYTDGRAQLGWLRNARSSILWAMGRHAEAADELKKASAADGSVSQRINHAGRLVRLGRGAEALPLLRDLQASPYGHMQAATLEVAAALQTGDRRVVSRALKYLEGHESDAIGALQSGFLSVSDFASAAGVLIKRLQSPEQRGDALLEVQHYLDGPKTPYEAQRAADLAALLARPDVMAALQAVGRIESHPIHEP
jgi:tetratricopeptide (TPR) repeat protein